MTTHKDIIEQFDVRFSVNKPPVIVSNPLIQAEEVKSFITSTLAQRDAELIRALESHKKILFEGRESQEVEKHNAVLDLAITTILSITRNEI